ncbi:MAG: transporter substrate-binding domain-containing diguanylate cyclase [Enterovibrio sp.]
MCFFSKQFTFSLLLLAPVAMAEKGTLTVVGSSAWVPFSFVNAQGKPDGIMVDFWRSYAQHNDVDVKFHLSTWHESLDYVQNNADAIHGSLAYTPSDSKGLLFSNELPLAYKKIVLFVRKGKASEDESISSGRKDSFLLADPHKNDITIYDTYKELFQAAFSGEINAFISDFSSAQYNMRQQNKLDDFIVKKLICTLPFRFAVARNAQHNVHEIEEGIQNIPIQEILAIYQKWQTAAPTQADKNAARINDALIYLFFITAAIISALGIWSYKKQLRTRTQELQETIAKLQESKQNMQNLITTDRLTGVKTRFFLLNNLSDKLFSPFPYVIAVLGVDKLKSINEQYGQDVGDLALRHFARQIKWQLPNNTLFARISGGEFAILFDEILPDRALLLLQKLQQSLKINRLNIDQQIIPVDFKYGIASYPIDGREGEALFHIAINRMRTYKKSGEPEEQEKHKLISEELNSLLTHV